MFLLYIQNVHEVDISIVAQIALVASERKAELQSLNIEQDTYVDLYVQSYVTVQIYIQK